MIGVVFVESPPLRHYRLLGYLGYPVAKIPSRIGYPSVTRGYPEVC